MQKTVNLHNDLLGCVEWNEPKYHFNSTELRCSLPQLKRSHVSVEVLAIGTLTTPEAVQKGQRQLELYQDLLRQEAENVDSYQNFNLDSSKIYFLLSIENASSLGNEEDSFDQIIERLETFRRVEKILYISLTWNHENIFGGGNASDVGLKPYGKELLRYLDKQSIAIDFSHTSDRLAYDLLNLIEKEGLDIPLIASHSNLRSICDVKRNLPDEIAKELYRKKAITGLNFVRFFVGPSPNNLVQHIEHALSLGGEEALALGADFFDCLEIPSALKSGWGSDYFFKELPDTSCFPHFIEMIRPYFSDELIEKIVYRNALQYIQCHMSKQNLLQKSK